MSMIGLLFSPFLLLFILFGLPVLLIVLFFAYRKKREKEFYKQVYMAVRQAISDSKKTD